MKVVVYAIGNGPELEVVDSLDFGYVHIYTQEKDTAGFYIKNEGVLDLVINSLTGFDDNFKLITSLGFPLNIAVGDSLYIENIELLSKTSKYFVLNREKSIIVEINKPGYKIFEKIAKESDRVIRVSKKEFNFIREVLKYAQLSDK